MMQSINFDDGYREFMINNDPEKVIRIDTGDYGIIERFENAKIEIKNEVDKYSNLEINPDGTAADPEKGAEAVISLSSFINEKVNYIFDSNVAEKAFGKKSPLSLRGGKPLYERFFDAVFPIIEQDVKKEYGTAKKRFDKYDSQAAKIKKLSGKKGK